MTGPIHPHDYIWKSPPVVRDSSIVKYLIVHHSDGPLTETVDDIHQQHLDQGWIGIGYHVVIYPNGTAIEGRPLACIPAAAQDANQDSVDVCLIGDFEPETPGYTNFPTQQQLDSLVAVSVYIHENFPGIDQTIGHRDVAAIKADPSVATACPGENLYRWLPTLNAKVSALLTQK